MFEFLLRAGNPSEDLTQSLGSSLVVFTNIKGLSNFQKLGFLFVNSENFINIDTAVK